MKKPSVRKDLEIDLMFLRRAVEAMGIHYYTQCAQAWMGQFGDRKIGYHETKWQLEKLLRDEPVRSTAEMAGLTALDAPGGVILGGGSPPRVSSRG